jgi:hypothetical protein
VSGLLGEREHTRRRYASGSYADGRWVRGAATDTTFLGSVQVLRGRDRQVLPEGQRSLDGRKVYCDRGTLRTEDQHAGLSADEVLVDGVRFTVVHLESEHELIEHEKAWLIRVQEGAP